MSMDNDTSPMWEQVAALKRASVNNLIPREWRITQVPSADVQPNVASDYLHQFLSPHEVEITETDASGVLRLVASGKWTAKAVTEAFCHRAALGHQVVGTGADCPR